TLSHGCRRVVEFFYLDEIALAHVVCGTTLGRSPYMMTSRLPLLVALSLLGPGLASGPAYAASGKAYPVNACVSRKQSAARAYCRAALRAWARWDVTQNDGTREALLASAAGKLDAKWVAAEAKSLRAGSDCADTTATAGALRAEVDSAIAAIVGDVNAGLSLGNPGNAACGAQLLGTAAA